MEQKNDTSESNSRTVHNVGQPETETAPRKRYRKRELLAVVVGLVILIVAALYICGESDTNNPLPTYTPTPADIDTAYSTAISRIDDALGSLDKIHAAATKEVNAAPEVVRNAVYEAKTCNIPIDSLTHDPRRTRSAHFAWTPSGLREVREAPFTVASDLAAARVASPADRGLLNSAANPLTADAPDLDPVLKAYWAYYRNDSAKNAYMAALDRINKAYMPVADGILQPALDDLISAFLEAPGTNRCMDRLSSTYTAYVTAFEAHFYAFAAYFAGLKTALEAYATALRDERGRHASSR